MTSSASHLLSLSNTMGCEHHRWRHTRGFGFCFQHCSAHRAERRPPNGMERRKNDGHTRKWQVNLLTAGHIAMRSILCNAIAQALGEGFMRLAHTWLSPVRVTVSMCKLATCAGRIIPIYYYVYLSFFFFSLSSHFFFVGLSLQLFGLPDFTAENCVESRTRMRAASYFHSTDDPTL